MELSLLLKALGEPTRFLIYRQLFTRKHCVRSLARKLNLTESAVSQHMKVLREADLVYGERYGHHIHYLPKQETLDEVCRAFACLQEQSRMLDRDPQKCQCVYRQEVTE